MEISRRGSSSSSRIGLKIRGGGSKSSASEGGCSGVSRSLTTPALERSSCAAFPRVVDMNRSVMIGKRRSVSATEEYGFGSGDEAGKECGLGSGDTAAKECGFVRGDTASTECGFSIEGAVAGIEKFE